MFSSKSNKNSNKNKTYFITGGGTGGHIYPCVAVIDELLKNGVDNNSIYYLGNKKNMEAQVAAKKGYNFLSYNVSGMPRKLKLDFIFWLTTLFFATIKAFFYVLKYRPSVVFASGGYVGAPVLFCALFLNIPYVLHDCDIHPGIVTSFFAKKAKCTTLAFQDAKKIIKSKNIIVSGNPIREEFSKISKKEAREVLSLKNDFTLAIIGGSLGAKKINDAAFGILKQYANKDKFKILWQTGKKNYDETEKRILEEFKALPDNLVLQPYFEKMYLVLLASDTVISRAGSLSISEICASSLASILIPYPYASQNHQLKNAKKMEQMGISLVLEDKDCNEETLLEILDKLINDKKLLSDLSYNASKNAKTNSTKIIVEQINQAAK